MTETSGIDVKKGAGETMKARWRVHQLRELLVGLWWAGFLLAGCGTVGAPIAPEDVGIEAKLRQAEQEAQQRQALRSQPRYQPIEEETVVLPPLQPITTQ
ncbi:MAG: hypothetical protein D6704_10955 [Nitrospirae bacterium]|nr:MAG: hypothetical protein D6704_10955 [Nitrospirota bacterium]